MTEAVKLTMRGIADSGLLARIVGIFPQLDLAPPAICVTVAPEGMSVRLTLMNLSDRETATILRKVSAFVGVDECLLVPMQKLMADGPGVWEGMAGVPCHQCPTP